MKVSVALHVRAVDQDGNQDQRDDFGPTEAQYQNYNRQEAELQLDTKSGNFVGSVDALLFPAVPEGERRQVFTHFSLGFPGVLLTDGGVHRADDTATRGGTIIIAGPLVPPITAEPGGLPPSLAFTVGVFRERLVALGILPPD